MNFNAKTRRGRFTGGKDARGRARGARAAESPHNPQFRPVRRAKISPFSGTGGFPRLNFNAPGNDTTCPASQSGCSLLGVPRLLVRLGVRALLHTYTHTRTHSRFLLREKVLRSLAITFQLHLYIGKRKKRFSLALVRNIYISI